MIEKYGLFSFDYSDKAILDYVRKKSSCIIKVLDIGKCI